MIRWAVLGAALLPLCACGGGSSSPTPPPQTVSNLAAYLAQSVAPDGKTTTTLTAAAPWAYERFGYLNQAEQSFQRDDGNYETIWSYPPYGPFVEANGDGGEVYKIIGSTAYITATQDGSQMGVVQQFGASWPIADNAVPDCSTGWETLGTAPLQTRACHQAVTYPASGVAGNAITADTIISEHGTGQVEVSYFAAGWGRLRWETWKAAGCAISATVSATPMASWEPGDLGTLCDARMPTKIVSPPPAPALSGNAWGWQP